MGNKVAIITGASSGIGKATAIEFGNQSYQIVLAARNKDKLKTTENDLKAKGIDCISVSADVSKKEECKSLIDETIKHYGRIDVLINNAGISMRAIFNDAKIEVIENVMNINFWGTVYCTKYALPFLLKSKGSVVGISSIAGIVGLPARTGYSASKFAMHGFLEALRTENLEKNLHVLIACPGFTASNIRNAALTSDGTSQGESPREEGKMMTAEAVAKHLFDAVKKRKHKIVLTTEGKMAFFLSKFFPKIISRAVFNKMKKEPDSPLNS